MRPILITAGATRNRIDSMRFISANSSGRTGAKIAEALHCEGLMFMGSPEACLRAPTGCQMSTYTDTLDLMSKMKAWVDVNPDGIVVHAAAVGDYMLDPADPEAAGKRPSGQASLEIRLVPAPKILDAIRSWSASADIVSFKAAPPNADLHVLEQLAVAQRSRTDSHTVFANTIDQIDSHIVLVDSEGALPFSDRSEAIAALVGTLKRLRTRSTQ
mgnify:CR=1 FL=1